MPPTPFHPTHTTPFKSSISSSQQARKRDNFHALQLTADSSNGSNQWPSPIDANQLDARHWTYLAEGGKNLLLRYTGPDIYPFVNPENGKRIALRIGKSSRQQAHSSSSSSPSSTKTEVKENHSSEQGIDPSIWQEQILLQDLSYLQVENLLPPLSRVQTTANENALRSFLGFIVPKIEGFRPIDRRRKSGIDVENTKEIFILEDLSAPIPKHPCVLFEIKPKCGFLPGDIDDSVELNEWKKKVSRFRMHSVLKSDGQLTKEEFDALYDPLDLYNGQKESITKTSVALYNSWQNNKGNNLRIFLDGKKVDSPNFFAEGETGVLEQTEQLAKRIWKDEDINLAKGLQHTLSSKQVQSVLARLAVLQQRYDPIDVEGVEKEAQQKEGKGLADQAGEAAISLAEYESMTTKIRKSDTFSKENLSLRELFAALLLSASYKDCSLFIRVSEGEQEPNIQTHLVDLDPKPIAKLPYLLSIDREITTFFSQWATKNKLNVP